MTSCVFKSISVIFLSFISSFTVLLSYHIFSWSAELYFLVFCSDYSCHVLIIITFNRIMHCPSDQNVGNQWNKITKSHDLCFKLRLSPFVLCTDYSFMDFSYRKSCNFHPWQRQSWFFFLRGLLFRKPLVVFALIYPPILWSYNWR